MLPRRPYLNIGDFAQRARLPVSTLRYYDRIGLLIPANVDEASRYRRYSQDQVPTAALICQLRSAGLSPPTIQRILAGGVDGTVAVANERERIEGEIESRRTSLSHLDSLYPFLMPEDVAIEIVDLTQVQVAALPYLLPATELESGLRRALVRLQVILRKSSLERTGCWGATFPLNLTETISGFVFAPVANIDERIDTAWLPSGRAVRAVYEGKLGAIPYVYHYAFNAVEDNGSVPAGPVIEEYLGNGPRGSHDSSRVHITIPIE